jgi:hypothetical protein
MSKKTFDILRGSLNGIWIAAFATAVVIAVKYSFLAAMGFFVVFALCAMFVGMGAGRIFMPTHDESTLVEDIVQAQLTNRVPRRMAIGIWVQTLATIAVLYIDIDMTLRLLRHQ